MRVTNRPWGNFKLFVKNKKCSVKILEVKPKQQLSLQYHKKRKEIWYFLTPGYVQLGMKIIKVKKGEEIKVKRGRAHRVIAKNKKVIFLEVAYGKYSEGDEIRMEDKYGRAKH
jgi:mannose-6-phosphate isomerase-like protein (cupin superfamily)